MSEPDSSSPWGWWAGKSEEIMDVGPFSSEADAISEALDAGDYDEVEDNGVWRRVVHSLEARGFFFECDECGIVKEACPECKGFLNPEESASKFEQVRNERMTLHDYPPQETT